LISKVDLVERNDREPASTATERSRPNSLPAGTQPKYVYYHEKVLKGKFRFGQTDNTNTIY